MKHASLVFLLAGALATAAHADSQHILRASFPDGASLEIFTETTGSSDISNEGSMGIRPGVGSQDLVNRVVTDKAEHILFAYNLEASRREPEHSKDPHRAHQLRNRGGYSEI
jgi:hypothetical protein